MGAGLFFLKKKMMNDTSLRKKHYLCGELLKYVMSEQKDYIDIHISGKNGEIPLIPANYDISELKDILTYAENLLFPNTPRTVRPIISYEMKEGSVIHRFWTSLQGVVTFAAVMSMVSETGSLDGLDLKTAEAVESIQKIAREKDYTIEFSSSRSSETSLSITAQTDFKRTEKVWVESEFYFYGQVQSAGGKTDAAIKIEVKGKGLLTIATEKDMLEGLEKNLLYHNCGVRAKGRQNIDTGEIDRHSLVLVSLVDYEPKFDENYLNKLIKKAASTFEGVDSEELMNELRGREVYA